MWLLNWWLGQFHNIFKDNDLSVLGTVWSITTLASSTLLLCTTIEYHKTGRRSSSKISQFVGGHPRLVILLWLLSVLFGPWIFGLSLAGLFVWGLCWFLQPACKAGWSGLKWAWIFTPSRIKTKAKPTLEELEKLAEQVRKEIEELGMNL